MAETNTGSDRCRRWGRLAPWLLLLVGSCADANLCASYATAGGCLDVEVSAQGTRSENIDSIRFEVSGALQEVYDWPPSGPFAVTPPLHIPVPLQSASTGAISIEALASLHGTLVGLGSAKSAVSPGAREAVPLGLMPINGASCTDGVLDGAETAVDCGANCPPCATGKQCRVGIDCTTGTCLGGACVVPTCTDQVKDGTETDVDCGGAGCPVCHIGQGCRAGMDCTSGVCLGGVCQAPSCTDQVKDGTETDVDCGGECAAGCALGKGCVVNIDCQSKTCTAGTCAAAAAALSVTPALAPSAGGPTLTVTGVGFPASTPTLTVGGAAASAVIRVSDTQVTATLPARPGKAGPVDVVLGFPGLAPIALKGQISYYLSTLQIAAPVTYAAPSSSANLALADVDGNGTQDLAVANSAANSVSVFVGNGNGTLQARRDYPTAGTGPNYTLLADVDGDGRPDLIVVNTTSNNVSVLLNDAANPGSFLAAKVYAVGAGPVVAAVGRLTGGAQVDIAVANRTDSTVTVLRNSGTGTFTAVPSPSSTGAATAPAWVALADVNKDTRLDLITANSGKGTVGVLLGNGDGTFAAPATYPATAKPGSLQVADLNGDSYPDVVVGDDSGNTVGVLLNKADGTYGAATPYTTGNMPSGLWLADLNLDGYLDLLVANQKDNTLGVLLGQAGGAFGSQTTSNIGKGPRAAVAGDLDRDGQPDVIVLNGTDNTVSALHNASQ